jgi:integrase
MTRRQANGDGDKPVQMRDGRWRTRITFQKPDGSAGRKAIYGKTLRECVAKKQAEQADKTAGKQVRSDERTTVKTYLLDWLETVKKPAVRPKTFTSYKYLVTAYIIPALGHHRLTGLAEMDVQKFINGLKAHTVKRTGKPMSNRTVHYAYSVLKDALQKALLWGLVKRNVAANVTAPGKGNPQAEYLTPTQARHFLDSVRGDRHETLYVLAIMCGLRQGELLGLRWQDIDLDGGTLTVRQTMQRVARTPNEGEKKGPATELIFSTPKTKASERTIMLGQAVLQSLRQHRAAQRELILLMPAERWVDQNLVFCTEPHPNGLHPGGMPIDGGNLVRVFHRCLEKAALPRIRFHQLRHTCASLLLAQGVPLKVVQVTLGHSDFNITAQTYSHVVQELKREAADSMDLWHQNRAA